MIQQTQTKQTAKLPAPPRQHGITIVRFTREFARAEGARQAVHSTSTPAEPSAREAYGCVEWFNYQEHPLDKGTP
jgi:hypothetical protein